MMNVYEIPKGLPVPRDDESTNHLKGLRLPNVSLKATDGRTVNFGNISDRLVIYCYPMTGQPNVALPDG
jgi:hypothetical protein